MEEIGYEIGYEILLCSLFLENRNKSIRGQSMNSIKYTN